LAETGAGAPHGSVISSELFKRAPKQVVVSESGTIYGVPVTFEADSAPVLERMHSLFDVIWRPGEQPQESAVFRIDSGEQATATFSRPDQEALTDDLEAVLDDFERVVRRHVAFRASEYVFVHAGVAVHNGHAVVLPGDSFSGKTTLVEALVRAGAMYFSDEYAVLGFDGLVYPFPKRLAMREPDGDGSQSHRPVAELGGTVGVDPVPVGLVVSTRFRPGVGWRPDEISTSESVLEIFGNTYLAYDRPEPTLQLIHRTLVGAQGLKGERGEANEVAPVILEWLSAHSRQAP
jgi:hypothetical protein